MTMTFLGMSEPDCRRAGGIRRRQTASFRQLCRAETDVRTKQDDNRHDEMRPIKKGTEASAKSGKLTKSINPM
jgi:hypothetical protein